MFYHRFSKICTAAALSSTPWPLSANGRNITWWRLSYHGIRIDWLKPVIPVYLHILARATEEAWLDQPIRIASAEGLILLKLLAFRSQDQLDIENLVAANADKLDLDWIKTEWQTLADLEDPRMRRLLELVGESTPR